MMVHKITIHTMGNEDDLNKVMVALSNYCEVENIFWAAMVQPIIDVSDEDLEILKNKGKETPPEPIPQSIFDDPDVVMDEDEGYHEFFQDVGDLRYGPMRPACKMCTNMSEACMDREFSKMEILDDTSHPPYIMVICSDFQSNV
jgi:hypothetical protein